MASQKDRFSHTPLKPVCEEGRKQWDGVTEVLPVMRRRRHVAHASIPPRAAQSLGSDDRTSCAVSVWRMFGYIMRKRLSGASLRRGWT